MAAPEKDTRKSSDAILQFEQDLGSSERVARTPTRSITGIKWALIVLAILSSVLFYSLDNSIVADIQPRIIDTFGQIDKLPWLSVGFALGSAATSLIWACIYTNFDAKYTFIVAVIFFEIGSAICGASNIIDALIFGRVLAGCGGGGLYVGALTLLSATTTPQERPIYVAATGLVWGLGNVLGPVIGGAFAQSGASWRWAFYINLVVGALFAPIYIFLMPSINPQPTRTVRDKIGKIDYVGSFLYVGALACGITGLSFGGSLFKWNSATIIALLVVAVVLTAAFITQQILCLGTTRELRLLPMQYFAHRTLCLCFILTALCVTAIFVPVYYISLFFQFTRGDGPLKAAGRLTPFLVPVVVSCLVHGAVMGKTGWYTPWYVFSAGICIAGSALMYTVNENTSDGRIYGYIFLLGLGAGCVVQTGFIVAQSIVPASEINLTVSFMQLSQTAGIVLWLSTSNTIFLNLAEKYVARALPGVSPGLVKAAISGTGGAFLKSLTEQRREMVTQGIVTAISRTYCVVIAAASLEFVLSFGLKWERVFVQM